MLARAIARADRFDHTIQVRNWIESGAAALVTVIFGMMAWHAPNALSIVGNALISASGVWIAFYMLRYGRAVSDPPPDRSLADYGQALLRKYDHQIRLLRNVKYWYLLPPYVGLLLTSAGNAMARAAEGRPAWPELIAVPVYSAVFAMVWWLNEVYGVRHVSQARARLREEMNML